MKLSIAFRLGQAVCIISQRVAVVKVGARDVAIRSVPRWHWAFVGVVMLSLVVTLATRTFHDTTSHSATVHSDSPQAMRQHMDRDAVRWTSPAPKIAAEQAPTFYSRVAPAELPLPTFLIEENLYNRPPSRLLIRSSYVVKS